MRRNIITRLYDVADDYESDVLDNLMHRARVLWTCQDPDETWTNEVGRRCERCNRTEAQSIRAFGRINR